MGTVINYLRGLIGAPATLDENQIVANICQHVYASVVRLKYSMVFDAYLSILLDEAIYERVKSNFDVIFLDVRNISFKHLSTIARKYHPYRQHCENFIIQFSSFKEDDDLSKVVGKNKDVDGAMYIVSRRQDTAFSSENAETRVTKISKMSRVLDAYSLKTARECGFEIKSDHRFSAPLEGFKTDMGSSVVKTGTDAKKDVCWGRLSTFGASRFEGGHRSIGLYHSPARIGGSDTPLEKNGVIGYRLDAGNIGYVVLSKEGDRYYISGTGLLNGQIHLSPDVREPLPAEAKILLGDHLIMFNSANS